MERAARARSLFFDDPIGQWRFDDEIRRKMGPVGQKMSVSMLNVFPNLFVPSASRNVAIRMPKGPTKSEIWMWVFVDKNAGTHTLSHAAPRK